jgi:hypothetical protein
MKPWVFAAEYELPAQIRTGRKRGWFVALAITAIVIGAGIALLTSDERDSPVGVQVDQ